MPIFSYFTIAKWTAIGLLLVGLLTTIGVQSIKIKSLKIDVEKQTLEKQKCYAQLETTITINQNNDKVMLEANNRYNRMAASYEKRLKDYEKRCNDATAICPQLKPSTGGNINVQGNINVPLFDRMRSMYP